jgi:hypothetical protein
MPPTGKVVPDGPDWFREIKFDGYRLRVERDGDHVPLVTRGGYDWDCAPHCVTGCDYSFRFFKQPHQISNRFPFLVSQLADRLPEIVLRGWPAHTGLTS